MRKRAVKKFNNPELKKISSIAADTGERQKNDTQRKTLMTFNTC